ncbi:MAG: tRNA (guanine(9)-N(1))-methyltransferase [Phylliscum demangeonii]|nr:MAG: tRNA (guanine(9)-N(1))-methyltransferase [Phylliscum demangeonii]
MEADERPSKLQKINHAVGESHEDSAAAPGDQGLAVPVTTPTFDGRLPVELPPPLPAQLPAAEPANAIASDPPPLTKNQQKKLDRQRRWEERQPLRKLKRKEQARVKKERRREARNSGHDGTLPDQAGSKRSQSNQVPITFVLDCSFDELMLEKERVSLASQLTRCYAENRTSVYRAHLVVSSFDGGLRERFHTVLRKAHLGWRGVRFCEDEDFVAAAHAAQQHMQTTDVLPMGALVGADHEPAAVDDRSRGEIVYLTSDSGETLTKLSPYSTYIVGGLVDHNRHKGLCYQRAMDRGLKTAKLPIGDYLQMASRFVLTTNQVVEIMLRWLESGDWGDAFLKVVPKRKGGVLLETAEPAPVLLPEGLDVTKETDPVKDGSGSGLKTAEPVPVERPEELDVTGPLKDGSGSDLKTAEPVPVERPEELDVTGPLKDGSGSDSKTAEAEPVERPEALGATNETGLTKDGSGSDSDEEERSSRSWSSVDESDLVREGLSFWYNGFSSWQEEANAARQEEANAAQRGT